MYIKLIRQRCCFIQDPYWHLKFDVPHKTSLGLSVTEAIETGIVSSVVRRRIIGVISKLVIAKTLYPTPEQYITVCNLLITKYPKLRDDVGTGIVSLKH